MFNFIYIQKQIQYKEIIQFNFIYLIYLYNQFQLLSFCIYYQFEKLTMSLNIEAMRKWLQEKMHLQASDRVLKALQTFSILYAEKLVRQCINDKALQCKAKGEKMSKVTPMDVARTYEKMKNIKGAYLIHVNQERRKKLIKMVNSQDLEIDKRNQTFLYMSNNIPHMMTKQQFQIGIDDSGKQIEYIKKIAVVIDVHEDEQKKISQIRSNSSATVNQVSQERNVDKKSRQSSKSPEKSKNKYLNNSRQRIDVLQKQQIIPSSDSNTSSSSSFLRNLGLEPQSKKVEQAQNAQNLVIVISQTQNSEPSKNTLLQQKQQQNNAEVMQQQQPHPHLQKTETYNKLKEKSPYLLQIVSKHKQKKISERIQNKQKQQSNSKRKSAILPRRSNLLENDPKQVVQTIKFDKEAEEQSKIQILNKQFEQTVSISAKKGLFINSEQSTKIITKQINLLESSSRSATSSQNSLETGFEPLPRMTNDSSQDIIFNIGQENDSIQDYGYGYTKKKDGDGDGQSKLF